MREKKNGSLVSQKKLLLLPPTNFTGNGIQDITLHRDDILYISLHRGNGFYPGTGAPHEVGDQDKNPRSLGRNANVAWPRGGLGDAEYDAAFDLVLLPLARAFEPDLVLVAAGFDAAAGDPLGGMSVSPRGYAHMTRRLLTLAGGRAVLALEGGYNVGATAAAAAACVEVLLSDRADYSSSSGAGAAAVPSASSASATTAAVGGSNKATRSGSSEEDEATTTSAARNASVVEIEEKSSGDDDDDDHSDKSGGSESDSEEEEEEEDGFVLGRAVARPSRDAAPALAATAAALAPHWPQSAELARVGTPAGFSAAWRDYCLKAKPARLTRSSRRKSL